MQGFNFRPPMTGAPSRMFPPQMQQMMQPGPMAGPMGGSGGSMTPPYMPGPMGGMPPNSQDPLSGAPSSSGPLGGALLQLLMQSQGQGGILSTLGGGLLGAR